MAIRISNCGKSENGGIYGNPGDQTREEYWNINLYNNGWQYVFRYPSSSVASLIALYAQHAADNDNIGYSQSGRETMWQQISFLTGSHDPANIQNLCNADCSSSTMAIIRAVGLDKKISSLSGANISWTTYSMISGLESLGFEKLNYTGEAMLKTGDLLMTTGHVCIVIAGNGLPADSTPPTQPQQNAYTLPVNAKGKGIAALQGYLKYLGYDVGRYRDRQGTLSGVDGDAGNSNSATNKALQSCMNAGGITEERVKIFLGMN